MALEGRYFLPRSTKFVSARALAAAPNRLRIEAADGTLLVEASAKKVRVSARLGRLARRFSFPDGGHFETDDNDGADLLLRELKRRTGGGIVDRIERSWRWVIASILVAALASYLYVEFGVPAIAVWLAQNTPPDVVAVISEQTMRAVDTQMVGPSKLAAKDKTKALALFARVAAHAPRGIMGYRLVFRAGRAIGPNAFALPDGTIVMTDELWPFVKNDDEIEGVFAHEMAHVDRAHGLQEVYQASLIPAAIAVVSGDLSQVSQLAAILPGILVESAYSRGFEQQADDDAAALLLRIGAKPSHMADMLERLDKKFCAKGDCPPSWIGSHPETSARAARLRAEEKGWKP
jgi:Zn-dependent protease with chaperone function